jgi:hypothetical protein
MSNDSFKLIEEKALVRGSTRGLGRAIAVDGWRGSVLSLQE